jgi:hypothetical protein
MNSEFTELQAEIQYLKKPKCHSTVLKTGINSGLLPEAGKLF